jgi:uncharacterized protein YdbL (DUF1318 family)
MLLKQQGEKPGVPTDKAPQGTEPAKPKDLNSMLVPTGWRVAFFEPTAAFAAESTADTLAIEISSMPEVLKAYDEMNARLPILNSLRDKGIVGETKQGLVAVHDAAKIGGNQKIVDDENRNRKAVITGMAKAILKLNKQPESAAALNQVLGKAATIYADTKREAARAGWWVELANGRWVQK